MRKFLVLIYQEFCFYVNILYIKVYHNNIIMREYKSPLIFMWQNMSQRVYDFIRNSRKAVTLSNPVSTGDTVDLYLSAPETIVKFATAITVDFNLNVIPVKCTLGDKLYLIMYSDGSTWDVTSTGNLRFNDCGPDNPPYYYPVSDTDNVIIPFIFDGVNFVVLDYC